MTAKVSRKNPASIFAADRVAALKLAPVSRETAERLDA
jgi:hypothetical protein